MRSDDPERRRALLQALFARQAGGERGGRTERHCAAGELAAADLAQCQKLGVVVNLFHDSSLPDDEVIYLPPFSDGVVPLFHLGS